MWPHKSATSCDESRALECAENISASVSTGAFVLCTTICFLNKNSCDFLHLWLNYGLIDIKNNYCIFHIKTAHKTAIFFSSSSRALKLGE